MAINFAVRLSISKFGLTSVNSMIFVCGKVPAKLDKFINSFAVRPIGLGAETPGASDARTESTSKPQKVES